MNNPVNSLSKFSILMSIYSGDNPEYLDAAIESLFVQTKKPDEIVLVRDGPVTKQSDSIVKKWIKKYPSIFKVIYLPQNVGLGKALQIGIQACSNDIVARMDADDVSLPDRFEKQMQFLKQHPDIALVNSWMSVFNEDPDQTQYVRKVPIEHEDIVRLAKTRSPINHPTAVFRRSAVLAAGNYPDRHKGQDYPLWVSMLQAGCRMACLPEVLLQHRCDASLVAKRHGLTAYRSQMLTQKEMLKKEFITLPRYITNIAVRTVVCFLPTSLTRIARTVLKM